MLVLTRRIGEQIVLPDRGISIQVLGIAGNKVRLGFVAPPDTRVGDSDSMKERSSWCYTRCSSFRYSPIAQTGGPEDVIPWD